MTGATAVLAAAIALGVASPDPFAVAVSRAVGREFGYHAKEVKIYLHKEGIAATTTALGIPSKPLSKHLWVNGIGMTTLCPETKIMAHLPLLLHPSPRRMLVVCFGMGTTVRSARVHKNVQCDVVELDPQVYECLPFFHADGPDILADSRIHRFADDGRNFLLMRPALYDVISMDPPPPVWSAGTVNLYTKEFFELCRRRLDTSGIMCLWIPPVGASEMMMIMKTFETVFPQTFVWRSLWFKSPGFFLTGFKEKSDLAAARFYEADGNPGIVADLGEWTGGDFWPRDILGLKVLAPDQLAEFVRRARVITDDHPYTEFPLWRSMFDKSYRSSIQLSWFAALKPAAGEAGRN